MAAGDPIHGKVGGAVFGAVTFAAVRSWTIDLTCDAAETTAMHATNDGKTRVAGILRGTATVTCLYTAGATVQVDIQATDATLKLQRTAATVGDGYYTGTAKCTGWDITADVTDVEMITYSFIFTGTVDLSVAA